MYYVYAYLRMSDLTPYYIGKGSLNRAFSRQHNVKVPTDKSRIIFLENNLTEVGALAIERRMIRWYGRKDLGTGILRNMTDGGDAPPNHTGMKRSIESRKKMTESPNRRFTGMKHSEISISSWVNTRRQNGSYIPNVDQILRLRDLRATHKEIYQVRICVFGKNYNSITEASIDTKMTYKVITHRLRSDKFKDCYYL